MRLKDLSDIDPENILRFIGLQRRRSVGGYIATGIGFFSAGLLMGAGAALLLAPKTGRDMREDLRERLRRVPQDAQNIASSVIGRDENSSGASKPY
jgi:hypothetical protein